MYVHQLKFLELSDQNYKYVFKYLDTVIKLLFRKMIGVFILARRIENPILQFSIFCLQQCASSLNNRLFDSKLVFTIF